MEIYNIYANQINHFKDSYCACIGYFDGVHLGHQKLIKTVLDIAKEKHLKAACICFDEDPWLVLNKTKDNTHLTPFSKRLSLFEQYGIEVCFVLHFDMKMASMNVSDFISLLVSMQIKHLVCGNDFHFARKGKGSIEDLMQSEMQVHIVEECQFENHKISSSTIEEQLKNKEIEKVNKQLGRSYALEGTVVHGAKIGRKVLGFATANLSCEDSYVIPANGVYQGYVIRKNKRYEAMINIGYNPTVNKRNAISIEAHLLDFDEMIYGEHVGFYFLSFLRDEKRFASKEELITQLKYDIETVRQRSRDKYETSIV